jgi:hypothetical protein
MVHVASQKERPFLSPIAVANSPHHNRSGWRSRNCVGVNNRASSAGLPPPQSVPLSASRRRRIRERICEREAPTAVYNILMMWTVINPAELVSF